MPILHDWEVESKSIGGYIEAGPDFPTDPARAQPGKVEAKVEVFLPVRSLKSMSDGKPYSNAMDDIIWLLGNPPAPLEDSQAAYELNSTSF